MVVGFVIRPGEPGLNEHSAVTCRGVREHCELLADARTAVGDDDLPAVLRDNHHGDEFAEVTGVESPRKGDELLINQGVLIGQQPEPIADRFVGTNEVFLTVILNGQCVSVLERLNAEKFVIPILGRSEEHTSELQSLMRISYAVFCLKKKTTR